MGDRWELDGYEVRLFRSERDGRVVIEIDTPTDRPDELNANDEPRCRVFINEATLYDGTTP